MSIQIPTFSTTFDGPIIFIGFGSIGKATLPLIRRHIVNGENPITVIDPNDANRLIAESYGATFRHEAITTENYEQILGELLQDRSKRGFIINVSNEVGSKDITQFAAHNNAHYIDTVVEPWPGFYFDSGLTKAEQSNYSLREDLHKIKPELTGTPTAISCCGANPGMVSWLVKDALVQLATEKGILETVPESREDWAKLMEQVGVKGIHIAERDTQVSHTPRPPDAFFNTWSAEGCMAECLQPAELGYGTHEETLPRDGHEHTSGNKAAIYLDAPGGTVKVRTWTPDNGNHDAFLVTHNEAISIADYFTVRENGEVKYRPTCHYAYRPSDVAVESLEELFGARNGKAQEVVKILSEDEIVSGSDQLGVLLYGHDRGAYWYGSTLNIETARALAPHQNATGLQVSSAILTGVFYALNHPQEGLIETDEMDYKECLALQRPYLGTISGHYTDWSPKEELSLSDSEDPWQFSHLRITPPQV